MFFQVLEKLFEIIVLALAVCGDNRPISYKTGQVLVIISPVYHVCLQWLQVFLLKTNAQNMA